MSSELYLMFGVAVLHRGAGCGEPDNHHRSNTAGAAPAPIPTNTERTCQIEDN